MEILLLAGLGVLAYVLWKRSRGERVGYGRLAGGCLGLGCLTTVILFVVGIAALWFLLQALGDVDVSLSDLFETQQGPGREGPGGRVG